MKEPSQTASARSARKPTLNIDHLPLPYVEMDACGIITRANRATLALHHPGQGDLIGRSGWDLVAIDEKDRSSAAFKSLMTSGEEPPVIQRPIFDRSGRFRTYEMHRSLIRNGKKASGVRMICIDVTEAKQTLEEARSACAWLESVFRSLAEALILTDALGMIHSVNPAAESLCGWSAAELKGTAIDEILSARAHPGKGQAALDLHPMLEQPLRGVATVMKRDKRQIKVKISTSPIFNKDSGSVSGVAVLLRSAEERD